MPFHAIAVMSGDRQKTFPNRTENQIFLQVVLPFVAKGVIAAKWGSSDQTYQALEVRIYETAENWDKRKGPIAELLKNKRNQFERFKARATKFLGKSGPRVFIIMPIQGEKYGSQEEQRVFKEYDERFQVMERVISRFGGVAIRIDKEHPLEDLVGRIKREIRQSAFVVADLTDERASCYFESGFAEALPRSVIYVASKQSVIHPGSETRIHFDIHMNVNFFTNHAELEDKLVKILDKNRVVLFEPAKEEDTKVLAK